MDPPYRDLQQVERHFCPLKTGLLEGRSLDVRKKNRTLGQVFAALRALKLGRELEVGLPRAFGTTAAGENALTITDALLCLSSSCLQRHPPAGQEVLPLPRPDAKQDAIFKALAVLPPRSGVQKPARV